MADKNRKTFGISLNVKNDEDRELIRELEARGDASATIRAALKLLFWEVQPASPEPQENPLIDLLTRIADGQQALLSEQQTTRAEMIAAIQSIQIVMPLENYDAPTKNGNGHHAPPDDELDPNDPLVRAMAGINFDEFKGG